MNRRKLLSGAAALAAYAALPSARAAVVTPQGLQRRDIALKSGNTLVGVAGFQHASPDATDVDATNSSLNSRMVFYAPAQSAITDITLSFPGFAFENPEVDWPVASYTVTATIEYPTNTFTPVYSAGSRTLTVNAGRLKTSFYPAYGLVIPAGAQFFVRCFAQWTAGHWMGTVSQSGLAGGFTNVGVGLSDLTSSTSTFSNNSTTGDFSAAVYGRLATAIPVLGILGTSHDVAVGDGPDPNFGGARGFARAMRGQIPIITVCKTGQQLSNYLSRTAGANVLLADACTHMIFDMQTNDIYAGASLATLQAQMPTALAPYLARGVKIWGTTVSPRTTSTDFFLTAANQTITSAGVNDAVRLAYNAWIRANYASLGMQGVIDIAHAVDPTDSSKWGFDASGASTNGAANTRGIPTMSGGTVASVAVAFGSGGGTYTLSANVPCVIRNMPGDTGSGAVVHAVTNGAGAVTSYVVDAPGSGYLYPPMISPVGKWTYDGIHFTSTGYDQVISQTGLRPEMFSL